jgi:hypothetical protein
VVKEVNQWALGKNLCAMLNEANGLPVSAKGALKRDCKDPNTVKLAYRKALLRIHPDKHMNQGKL